MAHPTAVLLVVGLNQSLLGKHAPRLAAFARKGALRRLEPGLPAVTSSVQSSMLTGLPPREHGVVGNGWYHRELAEVQFWKQSNRLVRGEKIWETARRRDPSLTCANLFWWFNMYSSADYSVTPRPMYKADGRKIPDCYSEPPELRDLLQRRFGRFPLFHFWGPAASIESSRWIAEAALFVHQRHGPTLSLVYLPHLDYALQKLGPGHADIPKAVAEIDSVAGKLIDSFEGDGVRVVVCSEYGIEAVDDAVHINRILREEGAIRVREEEGLELLDPGASRAFGVADHQAAHVYVKDPNDVARYKALCLDIPGVEQALDRDEQAKVGLDHPRAGELVLVADPRRWFSYDYWLDDHKAPDFARTVDIHRKPGYDPLELFLDPAIRFPKAAVGWKLLKRKLGFRTPLDVIPLDASLVRGSHGRAEQPQEVRPVVITARDRSDHPQSLSATAVRDVILEQLFED
jgi:predicted AlkP superfamily pyrophosphatase or phosphodiesterase